MPHDVEVGSDSLTGVWQGRYVYGNGQDRAFLATLMEFGAFLSGTTHELNSDGHGAEEQFAMVEGSRAGRSVRFVKTYDGSGGWSHSVSYEGTVSSDSTEIDGRWSIENAASGTFLMMRSGGKSVAATKRAYERA